MDSQAWSPSLSQRGHWPQILLSSAPHPSTSGGSELGLFLLSAADSHLGGDLGGSTDTKEVRVGMLRRLRLEFAGRMLRATGLEGESSQAEKEQCVLCLP